MPLLGWVGFDGLGLLISLVCVVTAFFIAWGALGGPRLWDYYTLVLLLIVLIIATTGAKSVLLFYVGWEVTAFAGWGLGRWASAGRHQTMMGALPLQGFGALGSLGMCVALLMLALQNRSLSTLGLETSDVRMLTVLLLGAIILKSFALLSPAWYPSREEQSFYPAHAVLASAGLLAVGLYPYLRFFGENLAHRPEWREPAMAVGLGIALLMALAALGEDDLHQLLAYATFSQFGGLIAFFALIQPADTALVALSLLTYTLAIAGLTLCVGAAATVAGQRDLRRMGGLINRMPVTAGLFLLCALSLAGLPPLGGFASRLLGILTLFDRGERTVVYLFFALGVVTLLYLLRLFHAIFLGEAGSARSSMRAAPFPVVVVASAIVLTLLFVGLLPGRALEMLQPAIELTMK